MDFSKGIVCKTLDYKDSSKILYIYTEQGNISVLARGVKKLNSINRVLSQVGNLISFQKTKGELPTLKEGELLNDYETIKEDLEAYSFVTHILELLHGTIDEFSDHSKMFHFVERLLELFNNKTDPEILSFIFELKLLFFLGYGINFRGCQVCGENDGLIYSVTDGGLICQKHLKPHSDSYDSDVYNIIKRLYYVNIDDRIDFDLSKNERIMIRHIIDMTYDEFVSYKTKSRDIIKQIKKY